MNVYTPVFGAMENRNLHCSFVFLFFVPSIKRDLLYKSVLQKNLIIT